MPRGAPMQMYPSELPLTVPEDVHLATDARAGERHQFDHMMEEKLRAQEVCACAPLYYACVLVCVVLSRIGLPLFFFFLRKERQPLS